jgi:hypothetical protein
MFVVASTTPSATPYAAIPATKTASAGASAITGTARAITASPARSNVAESRRRARVSATTEPTPASSTIISSRRDSSVSERCHRSEKSGSRVVRLMNTRPWVAKPPAAATRARESTAAFWSTGLVTAA